MQRQCVVIYFDECIYVVFHEFDVFRCVLASLYEGVSVRLSVCLSVGPSVTCFFFQTPKMSRFLYENHRGSPTLILLNVLVVLGVLNVPNVLHVPHSCASYMCFMCFICPWTHRWPAGPCFKTRHVELSVK